MYIPYILGGILLCGVFILVVIDLRAGFCLRVKGCKDGQYCKWFIALVLPCPRCIDLCEDNSSCGANAHCTAENHKEFCVCSDHFSGDPTTGCKPFKETCEEMCGSNTNCLTYSNRALCGCKTGFSGNPYDRNQGCTAADKVDAAKCWSEDRDQPSSECVVYFQSKPKKQFYIRQEDKSSWFEALSLCEAEEQMLAIIENRADQLDLDNKLLEQGLSEQKVWLAGSDLKSQGYQSQGNYQWVAGTTFNSMKFTNWDAAEPSGDNQHCVASERFSWVTENCAQANIFVCMNK